MDDYTNVTPDDLTPMSRQEVYLKAIVNNIGTSGGGSGSDTSGLFIIETEFDADSYYPDKTFDEVYNSAMAGKQVALRCTYNHEIVFLTSVNDYGDGTGDLIFSNVSLGTNGWVGTCYVYAKYLDQESSELREYLSRQRYYQY